MQLSLLIIRELIIAHGTMILCKQVRDTPGEDTYMHCDTLDDTIYDKLFGNTRTPTEHTHRLYLYKTQQK